MGWKGDVGDLISSKSQIFFGLYLRADWILAVGLGGVSEDAGAITGTMERKRACSEYWVLVSDWVLVSGFKWY